ncbi:16477_t:CDS:2 [Dentiscutata heterogama]|uniref:16477_t:CDS:1 n=1 Tax=Dentiscutata heterogama TaxID=1316150 RepID=A0ACA9K5Y4_9GLOM|nr:16477_t:CDS:2 [Dentiscutata heterogama]
MDDLRKFAGKLYFADNKNSIPLECKEPNICSICGREISSNLSEPVIILDCRHLFHWTCIINYNRCPCKYEGFHEIPKSRYIEISPPPFLKKILNHDQQTQANVQQTQAIVQQSQANVQQTQANNPQMQANYQANYQQTQAQTQEANDQEANDQQTQEANDQTQANDQANDQQTQANDQAQVNEPANDQVQVNEQANDQTREQENESAETLKAPTVSSKKPRKPKIPKKLERVVEVLTTAMPRKITVPVIIDDTTSKSAGEILVDLYNLAEKAEKNTENCNVMEIRRWYNYGEKFENRVKELTNEGMEDRSARTYIYKDMLRHLSESGLTIGNLRQKTYKARNLYYLFSKVGTEKINQARIFSANQLSEFKRDDIDEIIRQVKPNIVQLSISNEKLAKKDIRIVTKLKALYIVYDLALAALYRAELV